ncbi:hypothetical protein GXW84_39295 [Rhodococcus sp. IEGM 248]|nr:hypothetical protein [Rhodococcus sp. IEGM 248]
MRLFITAHQSVGTARIAWTGDPAGIDAVIDRGPTSRIRRAGWLSTVARWRRGDLWVDLHRLEAELSALPDAPEDWEANFVDMIEQAESHGHLDIEKMLLHVQYRFHDVDP